MKSFNLSAGVYLFKLINTQNGSAEHHKVVYHGSR